MIRRLARFDVVDRAGGRTPALVAQVAFGILCTLAAIGARFVFDLFAPTAGPLALIYPATLASTLYGRWQAGLVTYVSAFLIAWYVFLPPAFSFHFALPNDAGRVGVNAVNALVVLLLAEIFRRAFRSADEDRDRALSALEEREQAMRIALEAGRLGAWSMDIAAMRLDASSACKAIFGRSAEEPFSYDDLRDSIHPDDRDRMAAAVEAAMGTRRPYDIEYRILTRTGEMRWVQIRAETTYDETGRPVEMAGVSLDVTEGRRADARRIALASLTDEIRALDDPADVAFAAARILGDTLGASRVGYGTIETAGGDLNISRGWTATGVRALPDLLRFRDYGSFVDDLERGEIVTVSDVTTDARTADGAEVLTANFARAFVNVPIVEQDRLVAILYLHDGNVREWPDEDRMFIREVAERTRTAVERVRGAAQLRASYGRFRDIADSIDQMIWSTRPDGFHDYYNSRWYEFTGVPPGSTDGEAWNGMFHPDDQERAWTAWRHSLATGDSYRIEYRLRHRSGEYRWVLGRAEAVRDDDDTIARWYGTCTDIQEIVEARDVLARSREELETLVTAQTTELLAAEENLRQAQKMEAIGQLTGGVAHDFNNLLTVIRGSVELLRRPDLSDEKRERYVNAIGETADRAATLTGQLLAFARRQSLKPELFDVAQSLEALMPVATSLTGSRITLDLQLSDDECYVLADRNQFDTSIVNLAVNARDAMGGEGRITIAMGPVSGVPAVRGHPPVVGDFVAVTVADTGGGIAASEFDRIFEPFYTTKPVGGGTGLGLSQVIGFAKQSDGEIRVQSTVGEGTVFTLYLPRADKPEHVERNHESERDPRVDGDGVCVLVVEDNAEVGEFATQALNELGYDSVLACDGGRALELLNDDHSRFDIVFSDVVMPGISGLDLARRIREQHPQMPIVLASGYSHVLSQNGHQGFELLHKPYSIEQLSRVLRAALAWRNQSEHPCVR